MNKEYYIDLRDRYRPSTSEIKTVFVLESPPASGKYFYDDSGRISEPLFSAMMELLDFSPKTKQEGLKHFSSTGHFLVDATYEPVNELNGMVREKAILNNYENLVRDLKSLGNPKKINFVLIKANICRLLEPKLKSSGFNVINNGVILPFPSNGWQKDFREKIPEIFKFRPSNALPCDQVAGQPKRTHPISSLGPNYREATIADLPSICVLGQVVNSLHHEALPQIFSHASDPQRDKTYWRKSIENVDATTFVAETSGEILGFVTVDVATEKHAQLQPMRFARVGSICVAESARGRGIGRELMKRAEQWAAANGAVDVRLNVWAFNKSALRLYEELGYEIHSLFLGKSLIENEAR